MTPVGTPVAHAVQRAATSRYPRAMVDLVPGQYTDATTGLVNDRARFYESQTGSFTTRDPAFAATDQAYQYASGDPIDRSDPSGQATVGVCGAVSGFAGVAGF